MIVAWGMVILFGLEDAAVAAIGLAIIAATVPLARLAFNLARSLPWPIYLAADLMVKAVEDVINATVQWSEAGAQGLADTIQLPWQAIWTVARSTVAATESLYWSVWRVYYVEVPAIFGWAQQAIAGAEQAAFQHADQLAGQEAAYARQLVQDAIGRADAEWVSAVQHADQVGAQEAVYAQQLAQDAIGRADAEWVSAVQHADQVGAATMAYAETLWRDAIEFEQLEAARLDLGLERVEQAATDYAQQLAGDLVRDLAAAEAAVEAFTVAAVDGVAARVQDLEDSPCQRFCSPLGAIGQWVQVLEDAGLAAALIALAGEGAHDPAGTAQGLIDTFAGPLGAAGRDIRQAAGV